MGEDPDPKEEGAPKAMRGKNENKKTNKLQETPTGEKLTTKGQKKPKWDQEAGLPQVRAERPA